MTEPALDLISTCFLIGSIAILYLSHRTCKQAEKHYQATLDLLKGDRK